MFNFTPSREIMMKHVERKGLWTKRHVSSNSARVKNESWLYRSISPTQLNCQQDRMWHHGLDLAEGNGGCDSAGYENHHENSSTILLQHSYWLWSLIRRRKVVSGGGVGRTNSTMGVHFNAPLSWAGWFCGRHRTGLQSSVVQEKLSDSQTRTNDLHTHTAGTTNQHELRFKFLNLHSKTITLACYLKKKKSHEAEFSLNSNM